MSELFIVEVGLNTSTPCAVKYRALNGNPLQPNGHYMYRQFNTQQFYVLPTQLYLCVLCGSENKQRLFHYTALNDWFL